MPLSPVAAPSDTQAILTNIGVLIVALGAAFAGIMKGIRNAKKLLRGEPSSNTQEEKKQVLSAAIMETVSIREWSEQNRLSTEQTRLLCNRIKELIEELRDHRSSTRDFNDEARKLRLVVADLVEVARGLRK